MFTRFVWVFPFLFAQHIRTSVLLHHFFVLFLFFSLTSPRRPYSNLEEGRECTPEGLSLFVLEKQRWHLSDATHSSDSSHPLSKPYSCTMVMPPPIPPPPSSTTVSRSSPSPPQLYNCTMVIPPPTPPICCAVCCTVTIGGCCTLYMIHTFWSHM